MMICAYNELEVSVICSLDRRDNYSDEEVAMAQQMLEKLQRGEDSRVERVTKVRAALAAGQMERPLRLEIAVDRLLDDLAA